VFFSFFLLLDTLILLGVFFFIVNDTMDIQPKQHILIASATGTNWLYRDTSLSSKRLLAHRVPGKEQASKPTAAEAANYNLIYELK